MRYVFAILAVLSWHLKDVSAQAFDVDPALFGRGLELYQENCAVCHGADGDGRGPLASGFTPRPRDFTLGVFKIQSTDIGDYPSRSDIQKVIRNGIQGSFGQTMPAFEALSEQDLAALSEVIRFAAAIEEFGEPMAVTPRPAVPDLARGAAVYEELDCAACHGVNGDGNGPVADTLKDASGMPIRPADFRVGQFKGGNAPEEIWTRIYTGLGGTPMPSFGFNTSSDDMWAVTEYVMSFSSRKGE
ncbi:MAG: c-type cytochrome [Pseudomonadota bacterium]